jgi:hypothetical protein
MNNGLEKVRYRSAQDTCDIQLANLDRGRSHDRRSPDQCVAHSSVRLVIAACQQSPDTLTLQPKQLPQRAPALTVDTCGADESVLQIPDKSGLLGRLQAPVVEDAVHRQEGGGDAQPGSESSSRSSASPETDCGESDRAASLSVSRGSQANPKPAITSTVTGLDGLLHRPILHAAVTKRALQLIAQNFTFTASCT